MLFKGSKKSIELLLANSNLAKKRLKRLNFLPESHK